MSFVLALNCATCTTYQYLPWFEQQGVCTSTTFSWRPLLRLLR